MGEPPFVVSFEAGPRGKGNTVQGTLTLSNEGDAPRWLVISERLDARLEESFEAEMVQRCTFATQPTLHYVQALGTETGCFAFWLGPEVSVALDRFAFRVYGEKTAFQVWEVDAIHVGEAPVEECFPELRPVTEPVSVPDAFRRSTEATHEGGPSTVRLDVASRWAVAVAL